MSSSADDTFQFDAIVGSRSLSDKKLQRDEVRWIYVSDAYLGSDQQGWAADGGRNEWELTRIPRNGPINIFRRVVSDPSARSSLLHSQTTAWRDANVEPMDPPEFWQLIEVLGGNAKAKSIAKLADTLQELGPEATARFAVALHTRLRELDHPANAVTRRSRGLKFTSDDASQDRRAGIIARGRVAFDRAIAEPGEVDGTLRGAEPLIYVANRAMSTEAEYVLLDTGVVFTTGSNSEHWPPIEPPPPTPPRTTE
jgi:hypothetical protein